MTDAPERIWVSETPGQNLPYPEERRGAWTTNVGQYGNQVEYIRADLCRPEPQGWQPIETAPKDELETVILYSPEGVQVGFYSDFHKCWLTSEGKDVWDMPTHWMPLPEPPKP